MTFWSVLRCAPPFILALLILFTVVVAVFSGGNHELMYTTRYAMELVQDDIIVLACQRSVWYSFPRHFNASKPMSASS
jgi:hypothetical protein